MSGSNFKKIFQGFVAKAWSLVREIDFLSPTAAILLILRPSVVQVALKIAQPCFLVPRFLYKTTHSTVIVIVLQVKLSDKHRLW